MGQAPQHQARDQDQGGGVEQGPGPDQPIDGRLSRRPGRHGLVRVVADQPPGPVDPVHHLVAGVGAQAAVDALQLGAVADVDAHGADHDALVAVDASAPALPGGALLVRTARLAPVDPVGDLQGVLVDQGALDARPGAHVGAHLLAQGPGEDIGGEGQEGAEDIGRGGRLAGPELDQDGRGVMEIEDPGAPGAEGDAQPHQVLAGLSPGLVEGPGRRVPPHAGVTVALEQALDLDEEVGPDRLWTGIAAPEPAKEGAGQEQGEGGHHQEAGDEIDFLWPELQVEEIEAPPGEVDQDRLVRQAARAIPADPGRDVVDRQGGDHQGPLQVPPGAPDLLGIDGCPGLVEAAARVAPAAGLLRRRGGTGLLLTGAGPVNDDGHGEGSWAGDSLSGGVGVDVDGQGLDGFRVQPPGPGRHDAAPACVDLRLDVLAP